MARASAGKSRIAAVHLFSVWLHLVAAAIWVGGMLFLALVLVPVVRRQEYREHAPRLVHLTGTRFSRVGWVCLGLLVVSGFASLGFRGIGWAALSNLGFWGSPFGQVLGIKLALVAVILGLSAWHDFRVGPKATAAWQADPASHEATRLRRLASWFGRLNLVLALAVVALAAALVRGGLL